MERIFKWSLPVLIVANLVLIWTGVLEAGAALMVAGFIELLLVLVALRQLAVAVRRYRRDRAAGLHVEQALEDGLAVFLPRRAARFVALEPRIWVCLFRWLARRRSPKANEYGYSKRSPMGALLGLVIVTAPIEVLAFELLIPWAVVRWALLIASFYGAFWILGFYASLKTLPHRLEPAGLRLHYGVLADGFILYSQIEGVEMERRTAPGSKEGLQVVDGVAHLAVGGRTNITLRLREPVALQGLLAPAPPATTVCLAADEPARLARELGERLATSAARDVALPVEERSAATPVPA